MLSTRQEIDEERGHVYFRRGQVSGLSPAWFSAASVAPAFLILCAVRWGSPASIAPIADQLPNPAAVNGWPWAARECQGAAAPSPARQDHDQDETIAIF